MFLAISCAEEYRSAGQSGILFRIVRHLFIEADFWGLLGNFLKDLKLIFRVQKGAKMG